ncbi:hypothetical protein KC968_04040 [Candidatus Saccharibacteria bacterium]|nr:hypothetical protein [Candidatus Saccharibacteria bacterium]
MSKGYYGISSSRNTAVIPAQIHKHKAMDESAIALARTINSSHEILATATTVFPFTLFPDTVTLDRAKLTISHREFFWTGEVMSIRIEDILNVTVDAGPFFGSLKIFTRFFSIEKPYTVGFLYRRDAHKIKRILQGYIIALQKNIDCSTLPTKELADMLDDLGK